jgi:hypothetical protein
MTPLTITDREIGQQLLAVLLKYFPTHMPQRYGDVEPLRNRFNTASIDSALGCWGNRCYMTDRKSPKVSMMAMFAPPGSRPVHSSLNFFDFPLANADELSPMKMLVHELARILQADYAVAHILTRSELESRVAHVAERRTNWPEPPADQLAARMRARIEREGYEKVLLGATVMKLGTHQLRTCLPNLYWLNVFGQPYVSLFGRERITDAPCESVQVLPYGGISLNLTKDLPDTRNAWDAFEAIRSRCKAHLGSSVFCDAKTLKNGHYRIPEFAIATNAVRPQ